MNIGELAVALVDLILPSILTFDLLAIIYIVFFERRDPGNATVWVLVLIFVPVLGFFFYLLFGQHYFSQKKFRLKARGDRELLDLFTREQKKSLDQVRMGRSGGHSDPQLELMDLLLATDGSLLSGGNEVHSFVKGRDKFDALLEAIRGAEHHIHMEYYILRNDELGREVVTALTEKARQGVEVRLLFDALGNKIPPWGYRELTVAGGKVSEFYKVLIPAVTLRVNYHDHRKIAVIDGTTGFLGGFNIGEEYLGKGPLGFWRDTAIQINGPGVGALQLRFVLDWNYATGENVSLGRTYFPEVRGQGSSVVQIVSGGPDQVWNPIKEEYLKLIGIARDYIYLQTPYFIPDQSVLDALRIAALSGVDVRIMFPSKPDHPLVYWASCSYVAELLDAGVRAYAYNNGFIHAKTATVDDKIASIGTANWDIRSFRLNFETNAVVYDPGFAAEQRKHFEDDMMVSKEVTKEAYRHRPLPVRAKEGVARLFSSVL